jgi:hypothetical protein
MPDYKHFFLENTASVVRYTATTSGGGKDELSLPDRRTHGDRLLRQLAKAEADAATRLKTASIGQGLQFIPLEFEESSDFRMSLDRLESERKGVRVISARRRGSKLRYMLAVPDAEVKHFVKRFTDYRDSPDAAKKNETLARGIASIDCADLGDYWTDADEQLPNPNEVFWWEVWLFDDAEGELEREFRNIASNQQIQLSEESVRFPERLVILARTSYAEWLKFPGLLRYLAEFRRANTVTGQFLALDPSSQSEFIEDLLARCTFAPEKGPAVCVLDTGVNRGHPLIQPALAEIDAQSWRTEWTAADRNGHGTEMAGLALFGDLAKVLESGQAVVLGHRLESVKILPDTGANQPPDYGPITVGSMHLAEYAAPQRTRTFCLAVTASDREKWQPSLWSASLDKACAGVDDGQRRVMVVSAGNLREDVGADYPNENHLSSIEDPAQAWNVVTVGACSNKVWPGDPALKGYSPVAAPGGLGPASRTTLCWDCNEWTIKPDVVFEGGNYLKDSSGVVTTSDNLMVLTTQLSSSSSALLGCSRDTSAATAQVAHIAATLQADYPSLWPESVRALLIHSAEWTPRMRREFTRTEQRLRVYGWGVPSIERARRSAMGIATMVMQEEIQPFRLESGKGKTHQMHLHSLPIPRSVLQELGSLPVRMRVTLSYFIEPNPSRRGWAARYRYQSHGLRFDVKRPAESLERMVNRLTRDFWPDENRKTGKSPFQAVSDERSWELKTALRTRGSIHSDYWTGTAADLADSDYLAVYPVTGWWREQPARGFTEKKTRYSLIVTISTDATDINLYEAVEEEVAIRARTATPIPIAF